MLERPETALPLAKTNGFQRLRLWRGPGAAPLALLRRRPNRDQAGFTLIEVLVAFIIAALALGVLFEGSLSGLKSTRVATHYEEALSRARSHLAGLMVQHGFHAWRQSGNDGGGFRWHTAVIPLGVASVAGKRHQNRPALYALRVTISWRMDGGRRSVTLHSERLGTIQP